MKMNQDDYLAPAALPVLLNPYRSLCASILPAQNEDFTETEYDWKQ